MQPVTVNVRVGSVMPVLWSATGRTFGAFSKAAVLQSLIQTELASASPEQRAHLPNRHAVDALFEEIRVLRCAPVRDLMLTGVSAVAAPIFNASGEIAGVLTALGPSGGFDPTPSGSTSVLVRGTADSISSRLGYRLTA